MPSLNKRNINSALLLTYLAVALSFIQSTAQTNPFAQAMPYSQDFGLSYFSSLPPGFAAWNSSSSPCVSLAIAAASTGLSDQSADTTQIVKPTADVYGFSGMSDGIPNGNGQVYIQTSAHLTQGTCQLVFAVNTTGYTSISVGYSIEMISPQIRQTGVVFQYRVGTSGGWTTVNSSYLHCSTDRVQYQLDNFSNTLGASADNQSMVQLRWATFHATTPVGNSCGIGIDNIVINGVPTSSVSMHFRSISSGNWNNPNVWESSVNNITWTPATRFPSSFDQTVTIRAPHSISTTGVPVLIADELTVDAGATLWYAAGTALTINDGASAVDLDINGTFKDSSNTAVIFLNNSTWRLGAAGTIIKATNSNSRNWQMKYYTGIANIPSTSNWIFRKPLGSSFEPSLVSTNYNPPYPQAYYGNVSIENYTASWSLYSACRFGGTLNYPVIKGNLYIGGNGTGPVNFLNNNFNASPVTVIGDLNIKSGSSFQNQGKGLAVQGNVINNGTISYLPYSSTFDFTGGNTQTISGTGTFSAFNLKLNKTVNDVTSNQSITVDGSLNLTNGRLFTSALYPLTLNDDAMVINASNVSFVNGPISKSGDDAFIFPVGKNADYQPIAISAGPAKTPFWTELFNNGCVSGCQANLYFGPHGFWGQTLIGTNGGSANIWYVSGKECGNGAGSCQGICTNDASLHIGTGVSPTYDSGATYYSGLSGPLLNAQTNVRIYSPAINCTGKYNIIVDFNYLEGGNIDMDNALFLYYNGATWFTLADLGKTTTGSCGSGSTWTNFRMALPAAANNNANVRIGFQWMNDADGVGTNPSFAVDDISLTDQSDKFTAEYFRSNPQVPYSSVVAAPLNHVSYCEYWNLTRNTGVAAKNVTLAFDANSCGVTNLSTLTVARYNAPAWVNEGQSMVTGTTASGTITSNVTSGFGPFTLASLTNDNPLPVSLINFNAAFDNDNFVNVNWTTATEINNDYFTVQRSPDAISFEDIVMVDGAGNSVNMIHYTAIDKRPYEGISYYRLLQTDFNGNHTFSKVVKVQQGKSRFDILFISPVEGQHVIESSIVFPAHGNAQVLVIDLLGRTIFNKNINVVSGSNIFRLSSPALNKGLYFMQIIFQDQKITKRFRY